MNDLIGRRVLQKVQTVEGSGFYNYGSDAIPTATAKTEFNKAVGSKCQAIAMAEAKAAQSQVAKSSGSSSSGKSDSGGGSGGDLLAAAKEMAPLALAVPGVKEAYDKAKDKVKDVAKSVGDSITGKKSSSDSVDKSADVSSSNSSSAPESTQSSSSKSSTPTARSEGGITASNGEIGANMGRDTKSEIKPVSVSVPESNQQGSEMTAEKQRLAKDNPAAAAQKPLENIKDEVNRSTGDLKKPADSVADGNTVANLDAAAAAEKAAAEKAAADKAAADKAAADKAAADKAAVDKAAADKAAADKEADKPKAEPK